MDETRHAIIGCLIASAVLVLSLAAWAIAVGLVKAAL